MRTKPCLNASDVKEMLAAAEALAQKNKWGVAIVVLDDSTHMLGMLRMDGATPFYADVALGKARTAALTRLPSKFWADRIQGGALAPLALPLSPFQGGLPIMVDGECVGAIAASGAKADEDEQVAQAGIDALGIGRPA